MRWPWQHSPGGCAHEWERWQVVQQGQIMAEPSLADLTLGGRQTARPVGWWLRQQRECRDLLYFATGPATRHEDGTVGPDP